MMAAKRDPEQAIHDDGAVKARPTSRRLRPTGTAISDAVPGLYQPTVSTATPGRLAIELDAQDVELALRTGETILLACVSATARSTILRAITGQPTEGDQVGLGGVHAASINRGGLERAAKQGESASPAHVGQTGLEITRVGFGALAIGGGAWEFGWGPQDDESSLAAIHRALKQGMNWIESAAAYGFGRSEQTVRRALRALSGRPYVFTKQDLDTLESGTG